MQLVSAEETAQLDKDWEKWRKEWVRRRKVFHTYVRSRPCLRPIANNQRTLCKVLGDGHGRAHAAGMFGTSRRLGRRARHPGAHRCRARRTVFDCFNTGKAEEVILGPVFVLVATVAVTGKLWMSLKTARALCPTAPDATAAQLCMRCGVGARACRARVDRSRYRVICNRAEDLGRDWCDDGGAGRRM